MSADCSSPTGQTRRRVTASLVTAAAGSTAGCVRRLRNVLGRQSRDQLSLRVLVVPADTNPTPVRIARELGKNLERCGIAAQIVPVAPEQFYRQVLLNHEFDVYVGQFPAVGWSDPDRLYSFLHSDYASEPGWQNPFNYVNLDADDQLEAQRTSTGATRRTAVDSLQRTVARTQPFTTLAFPDSLQAVREDSFLGWRTGESATTLMALTPVDDEEPPSTLRLSSTDDRVTSNRNPLAAEFRRFGTFADLLYDPLVRRIRDRWVPWLAEEWSYDDDDNDGRPTAELTLREGLAWHDGEPIDAEDVAFTYQFVADTSMGEADSPVPAPRFRGRVSLVDDVVVTDDRSITIRFDEAVPGVATRAFTVPLLPEHVWTERTDPASIGGVDVDSQVTEALVWTNPDPVGSGPLAFERAAPGESLTLSRFEEHFLTDDDASGVPRRFAGGPAYETLKLRTAGTDASAVELVASGQVDATVGPLGPAVVPRIGRQDALRLIVDRTRAFYHVGYNARRSPLSNPRFRSIVARLLNRTHLVEEVFDTYATPAASPLAATDWLADALVWDDDLVDDAFVDADGDLDAEGARQAFVDAGYSYDDGNLVAS